MKTKELQLCIILEASGIIFCVLFRFFTQRLCEWCNGDLMGVLFGAVNQSIWEQNKTTFLAVFLWGILEIMIMRYSMKRLTVAKTVSLYASGIVLLLGGSIYVCVPVLIGSAVLTVFLFRSELYLKNLFAPCIFLLFLFLSFYFCFTPFPPHFWLFEDVQTHFYGIIPAYIDKGAAILSN